MLCRIKLGKRQEWLDWCSLLMTVYLEEARETLGEENLINEMCLVFGAGDDSFVVYRHETQSGKKKPANMERELNKKHFDKFHECLEIIDPCVEGYSVLAKER